MNHRFCVAPMMDRTDRHERYFLRTISTEALLYTEMIHANAVIKGDTPTLLKYHAKEQPLAIQLGGSDPSLFCLLYTSPSPRDGLLSRMPSSA